MAIGLSVQSGLRYETRIALARGAGIALTLCFAGILIGTEEIHRWQAEAADARYWTVAGAPCSQLTPQAFQAILARGRSPDLVFDFGGVRFARESGWASCEGRESILDRISAPVCQFSGPDLLAISTPKGEFYFEQAWGGRATVSVTGDRLRCVRNSNFR